MHIKTGQFALRGKLRHARQGHRHRLAFDWCSGDFFQLSDHQLYRRFSLRGPGAEVQGPLATVRGVVIDCLAGVSVTGGSALSSLIRRPDLDAAVMRPASSCAFWTWD